MALHEVKRPRCARFRIGIKGTRSIFYNHEGATFNKTDGGSYTFYMATDSGGDIPAGLNNIGADKVLAVWRIGYFSDGPEIDEPTHPVSFSSARLKFKYSPEGLDGLDGVYVYRHDGTANGTWVRNGKKAQPLNAFAAAMLARTSLARETRSV